jgi:spermidine synthase
VADAFAYTRRCERHFDAICVDLYVAGKMTHGVLGAAFLRDVARLLTPRGIAAFNLWRSSALADAIRRVGRELRTFDTIDVDDNVILRCARPYGSL